MKNHWVNLFAMALLFSASCQEKSSSNKDTDNQSVVVLDSVAFKDSIDGKEAKLFTLTNEKGMTAYLTNFGARLVGLIVPDKDGKPTDVVLGFNTVNEYNNTNEPYFGPIVGPFGNRIAKGKLTINGEVYNLPTNNGPNTLHGGFKGVHFAVWEGTQEGNKVTFKYTLPDGHEGFPGNIAMTVSYSLTNNNDLIIDYSATTDKETVINLTNHAYFNLNGEGSGTILDHTLQMFSTEFTPVDSTLIPTGEILKVTGTPFDFLEPKTIGKDIQVEDTQLRYGKGYDHNFVLNGTKVDGLNHAVKLTGDKSNITMDIFTAEPGIQFYSGNFMSEKVTLKNGKKDSFRTGLCLEPQHYPDSPNQPNFPSTSLKPGQVYETKSVYRFSVGQ